MSRPVTIGTGFTETERGAVGRLYWQAFGRKLSFGFRDERTGCAAVTAALRPEHLLVARRARVVVGALGHHGLRARADAEGQALDLRWRDLRDRLGLFCALQAAVVLAPLDRRPTPGTLVLDGICVDPAHRGAGIGTHLLGAAVDLAFHRGDSAVELSVVDSNPRAAALYDRLGFRVVDEGSVGPLARVYGFDRYRTMRLSVTGRIGQ